MGVAEIKAAAVARRAGKDKPADKGDEGDDKGSQPQTPPTSDNGDGDKNE